jgi:DNA (cytosine-5)-methyltransferase 1
MAMRLLDLFSGIGGFSYAAETLIGGYETVAFCEMDEFCQKVLKKHWPQVPIYDDVRTLDAARLGRIDICTFGFPCQPVSQAGVQKGESDDRWLWDEIIRILQVSKPKWIIAENVVGLITIENGLLIENCISSLEAEGYEVQSVVIPACSKNAPHRRSRIWLIGQLTTNTNDTGNRTPRSYIDQEQQTIEQGWKEQSLFEFSRHDEAMANSDSNGHERGWSETRNQNTTGQNTQGEWSANTKNIKRQNNDGLDNGEPRVDGDLSGSSDRGTTISTDTTGVCGLFEDADNNQGISSQHKYQENNDRTLVSQGQKRLQLSEHRGLATDQTIAENNTIRSGDDNNSNERMENKESNVAYTNSIRCRGGNCKGCSDCKRQVLSTERKGREMGSEVEGCSQSHRGEETVANTESINRYDNGIVREHGEAKTQEILRNRDGIRNTQGQNNVSNSNSQRGCSRKTRRKDAKNVGERSKSQKHRSGNIEQRVGNLADGISRGLLRHFDREPKHIPRVTKGEKDRAKKLKALGNSIVPQVAAEILLAIRVSEESV